MTSNDLAELVEQIELGEDAALELKRVQLAGAKVKGPKPDDLADELAAFANARGGTLVLGVDDNREVAGIPAERLDDVERWVVQICRDRVKPVLDVDIRKRRLPDSGGQFREVLVIDVPRSLFVHQSPGGYFRRLGSSKVPMPPEVLARLFQERSQSRVIHFDESPVAGAPASSLEARLYSRFLRQGSDGAESLMKLRMLAELDGVATPTVAGLLLGAEKPERYLPHAVIQAVVYQGERSSVDYQLDARDIGGPLDVQVEEAFAFFLRNTPVRATKTRGRIERRAFSERAVFEALVNAVAHRDYSIAGSRIRFHIFGDRIELRVPGGLPNTLTVSSMPLRQYSRNELIVSLLARIPSTQGGREFLMDRRGDGVPIILDETLKVSGRPAEYRVIDDAELELILRAAPPRSAGDEETESAG